MQKNFLENIHEELEDDVYLIGRKFLSLDSKNDRQTKCMFMTTVVCDKEQNKYYKYFLLSSDSINKEIHQMAIKKVYQKGYQLLETRRGHIILQLIEWLEEHNNFILFTFNSYFPLCRKCALISTEMLSVTPKWQEKGCLGLPFPLIEDFSPPAEKYILKNLSFILIKKLMLPLMDKGDDEKEDVYVSKQKDEEIKFLQDKICSLELQVKNYAELVPLESLSVVSHSKSEDNIGERELSSNSEWFQAVKRGNKRFLVDNIGKVHVDCTDEKNRTALMKACKKGNLKIVKWFVSQSANVNLQDNSGITAALEAASNKKWQTLKYLLDETDVDVNLCTKSGWTLLMEVVKKKNLEFVKHIINRTNVDVDFQNNKGTTALILASVDGSTEILKFLVEQGKANLYLVGGCNRILLFKSDNYPDGGKANAIQWATYFGRYHVISFLNNKGTW